MSDYGLSELSDGQLVSLHDRIHKNVDNPAHVQAHHLLAVELGARGLDHGHTNDVWSAAVVEVAKSEPQNVDEAFEGIPADVVETALAELGYPDRVVKTTYLSVDGYVVRYDTPVAKHGQHDQSSHGNWAHGVVEGDTSWERTAGWDSSKNGFVTKYKHTVYDAKTQAKIDGKPDSVLYEGEEIKKGRDSLWHHLVPDGEGGYKITRQRQRMHSQMVNDALRGIPQSDNPTFLMMGGGGGSGKGHIQKDTSVIDEVRSLGVAYPTGTAGHDYAVIDADEIKTRFPDFAEMVNAGNKHAAPSWVHEESSIVTKAMQAAAEKRQINFVLDGVGDSSRVKLARKIESARAAGYRVDGLYVSASIDTAWEGNMKRASTSRHRGLVPSFALLKAHTSVSDIVPDAGESLGAGALFDHFVLYDTNNRNARPQLVAKTRRGRKLRVMQPKLYADFVAKSQTRLTAKTLDQRWIAYQKKGENK